MNRLQAELQRLYFPLDAEPQVPGSEAPNLIGPDGQMRAVMLELARPASWEGVSKIWRGVQADLELPAPAIAVSGIDGYQLWFSLSQAVPVAQAKAFLESLRRRWLGDIAPERIEMNPSADDSASECARHAKVLPPARVAPERWSAFVAPDLAALFADEPWLDLPPGHDAQAELLSRLESTRPGDWNRALERLETASTPAVTPTPASLIDGPDPKGFLLKIMNDPTIELHLRIEAAKALLPYFESSLVPPR